jgi:hypothetical protein
VKCSVLQVADVSLDMYSGGKKAGKDNFAKTNIVNDEPSLSVIDGCYRSNFICYIDVQLTAWENVWNQWTFPCDSAFQECM